MPGAGDQGQGQEGGARIVNGVGWLDAYTHPRIVTTPGQEGDQGPGGAGGQGQDGASGGQAVPKVTTFMSYNMTGADKIKCKWINYVAVEQGVNYAALQEHFKTVKSTEQ